MKKPINNTTLAEIVTSQSKAAILFEEYNLDYCCKGGMTVEEAVRSKGLDLGEITGRLEAIMTLPEDDIAGDLKEMTATELSNHIVENHHTYVKQMLPVIAKHAAKVAERHGDRNPELHEITFIWEALMEELGNHMMKEERILFPYLKTLDMASEKGNEQFLPAGPFVSHPIQVMEMEHETAGELMEEIRELTRNYTLPPHACATYQLLFRELREFEIDLHKHVHLENNLLFPKGILMEKRLLQEQQ